MKKNVDCRVFEDQLDALVDGRLTDDGVGQLRLHASSCEDCGMLLRLKEHMLAPSLGKLEAAVPDEMVASMWERVQAEVASLPPALNLGSTDGSDPSSGAAARPSAPTKPSWLIPTLAAASVALLFSTGFLFSELQRVQERGSQLSVQVESLKRDIEMLDSRTEWVERTAQLAGNRRNRLRALDRMLAGQEFVTVANLVELLELSPPDQVVFDTSKMESLLGGSPRLTPNLREVLSILDQGLRSLGPVGEVRAGDLAEWLTASGISQDLAFPKAQLKDLLS
ncbi:MAG: hypothetical protein HKO65_01305 [Gemmatimonadetes bacterium]|nr:zf-HC2 domain-containing protein [Gemmatimonadota bacterium]NNM03710.1 hypothetical protein [Gemmatimonadota bacterium]